VPQDLSAPLLHRTGTKVGDVINISGPDSQLRIANPAARAPRPAARSTTVCNRPTRRMRLPYAGFWQESRRCSVGAAASRTLPHRKSGAFS
jgi:hypothetical protein